MTEAEKLIILKSMYNGNENDSVLSAYLKLAGQKVIDRAFPFKKDVTSVPNKYVMNQIEIAVYLLNKQGAEGETAHNENGINRSYESGGVPESMLEGIIPFTGVL